MASKEANCRSLRLFPFTVILTLHLLYFSSWYSSSSAALLNSNGGHVLTQPYQKLIGIRNRLREINKPVVKSIQSPDGDIIDCILRHKQHAFDHPLLRNHTIHEPPKRPRGTFPSSSTSNRTLNRPLQVWHLSGISCPDGTIPVRRTSVKDLMRFESPRLYGRKYRGFHGRISKSEKAVTDGHEHSFGSLEGGNYFGTSMVLSIWVPRLEDSSEFSLAQLWVMSGSYDNNDLNTAEAGWQVYPDLHDGSASPRLFVYWTSDAYQNTGCYNLLCSGFVQTSSNIAVGAAFSTISSYDGEQHDINFVVYRDRNRGNWWLELNKEAVGYWPAQIYNNMQSGANKVEWGGEVLNGSPGGHHTATEMGSGHFAQEGYRRAAYFRNLQIVDSNYQLQDATGATISSEFPNCYNAQGSENGNWGEFFYFGGPGLNSNCQ